MIRTVEASDPITNNKHPHAARNNISKFYDKWNLLHFNYSDCMETNKITDAEEKQNRAGTPRGFNVEITSVLYMETALKNDIKMKIEVTWKSDVEST